MNPEERGGVVSVDCHFKMADVLSKFKSLSTQHKTSIQFITVITGSLLFLAAFLSSYFHILLIVWSLCIGLLICQVSIRPADIFPNLVQAWNRQKKIRQDQDDEFTVLKTKCPVCGQENCNRHRPELNIVALQPWSNLRLPESVNSALEEFLNLVLKEFVYTWYRDLSEDEAFVDELRSSLRFIVSVLLRRVQKVDIPSLVLQRILKIAIRHLHFYLEVKRKKKGDVDIQQAVLDFYNGSLHVAVRNRRAELDYLKAFVERAFPYILPIQSHKCKCLIVLLREILAGAILLPAMDVLADPDIINNLLLIFFDKSPPPENLNPPSPELPLLENLSQPVSKNDSCLHMELDDILECPDTLFHFMQFLKAEASVNVLQFYLSVDEFNNQLLTPELSKKSLVTLHQDLKDMYKHYCDPESVDKIKFEDDIIVQLQQICDGPPEGVIKLQTTTPLFRAHERMYDLLKNTFLPLFHQSDDYYQMLCGERLPTRKLSRSLSKSLRRQDALSFSRLGTRIKGVFKSNTVDGHFSDDVDYTAEEVDNGSNIDTSNGLLRQDEDLYTPRHYRMRDDRPMRDLSAWRVSIPEVLSKHDLDNPKRETHLFIVEVRRVDVMENDFEASNWTVERRYPEFYVLEQKLTEFHGEFDDIHLPSKKAFGTKKKEFLESIRPAFELYLQNLLSLHILKGSELLYQFLTPFSDFSGGLLDINLGRMMKSGALKLVKERGQNLELFLQSLLLSAECAKPKPSRFSDKDSDTASISSEKMANLLYENNANTDLNFLASLSPNHTYSRSLDAEVPVEGIFDTLVYLAETLYGSQPWIIQLLLSFRIISRKTVDYFIDWYLARKLRQLSEEHRVVQIIHLLRDALFFDTDPPRTDEEKQQRRDQALTELQDFIPMLFAQGIGAEKHQEGTQLVFEVLQHPKLNKQLLYTLLDAVIEEAFPEITRQHDPFANIHKRLYKLDDDDSS